MIELNEKRCWVSFFSLFFAFFLFLLLFAFPNRTFALKRAKMLLEVFEVFQLCMLLNDMYYGTINPWTVLTCRQRVHRWTSGSDWAIRPYTRETPSWRAPRSKQLLQKDRGLLTTLIEDIICNALRSVRETSCSQKAEMPDTSVKNTSTMCSSSHRVFATWEETAVEPNDANYVYTISTLQ